MDVTCHIEEEGFKISLYLSLPVTIMTSADYRGSGGHTLEWSRTVHRKRQVTPENQQVSGLVFIT